MKDEARQYALEDQEMKDKAVKSNKADMQISQTETQLKEFGDTIPTEKKIAIEVALGELKLAHKNPDFIDIGEAMDNLSSACQLAGEYLKED